MTTYRGSHLTGPLDSFRTRHSLRRHVRRTIEPVATALMALGLILLGEVPASAAATTTYHASLGAVESTLTVQGAHPEARNAVLTISTSGHVQYRHAVASSFCGNLCWPQSANYGGAINPLQVVRLGPGAPAVILGLFSGGAHCCGIDEIFAPDASTKYVKTEVFFGDAPAQPEKLPGDTWRVFVSADDSFAYEFTDYAALVLPLKILSFVNHRIVDVTRLYPLLIARDARIWLRAFNDQASSHYVDSVGVIAAWTADEYLL